MIKFFLYILPFLSLFIPNLWVQHILRKNNRVLSDMPFTGRELGEKILHEQQITNVLIHLITLPVEFDASFKRALPILQKFVPKENMKQCRSVLRAAALTYLAQSIVSIFRLKVILFSFINIFKSIIRRLNNTNSTQSNHSLDKYFFYFLINNEERK